MTIEISADDAQLLESLVASGEYDSIASCVHVALSCLVGEFDESAAAHIEEGMAQIERGETLTMDEVRVYLEAEKAAWRREHLSQ